MAQINVPKLTTANGHLNVADLAICARKVSLFKLTSKITHQVQVSLKAFIDNRNETHCAKHHFGQMRYSVLILHYTREFKLQHCQ